MVTKKKIEEMYASKNEGHVPAAVMRQLDKYEEDAKGIHTTDMSMLLQDAPAVRYLEDYEVVREITDGIQREYMDLGRIMYMSEGLLRDLNGTGDLPGGM